VISGRGEGSPPDMKKAASLVNSLRLLIDMRVEIIWVDCLTASADGEAG
jgi:hypothetical protein